MTDYPFDQILAADPSNPQIVASNGVVTIFAPGDATKTPLALKTLDGLPQPNPVTVNKLGFGPPYIAPLWEVAWEGGGLSGLYRSNVGLRDEAVAAVGAAQDAQAAAEAAAATAGTEAAAVASAALAGAVADAGAAKADAESAANSAAASAELVAAPADTAVQTLVSASASSTRAALKQAMADIAGDPASAFRGVQNATYAGAFPEAQAITYNADGSVATVTENGITTTYTYNADGTVATDSRTVNGVTTTRNYGYTNGNLTSITKAA